MRDLLTTLQFNRGFNASLPALDPALAGTFAPGSRNQVIQGSGKSRPFKGTTDIGANTGSRLLFQLGKTWGGLKDINVLVSDAVTNTTTTVTSATANFSSASHNGLTAIVRKSDGTQSYTGTITVVNSTTITLSGAGPGWTSTGNTLYIIGGVGGTQAAGSLWEDLGRSLWYIGAGQVHREGTDIVGVTASSILKTVLYWNGSYNDVNSGPYSAGLSQPSAPDIAVTTTAGIAVNPISFKIARLRTTTGARSIASSTSVVVVPASHKVRVTFPIAAAGQNYWALFRSQEGFGGVGLHYRVAYNGSLDIAESVIAASSVGGIARSIEVDLADADLVDEVAWIDDYPPPAGTHAARLENVHLVLGCYSDASSAPTSSNPGTCAAVSLPNFYESYKPRHLLYFPEQIVSTLQRPSDSFMFTACRNSTQVIQYVGLQDGPACTISTVWPDVGIAYPHNWCQVAGRLCAYIAKGSLVFMGADGQPDFAWAAPIRDFIKDWDPQTTIVGWNPETLHIWVMNGDTGISFSLQSGQWGTPVYLSDFGVTGTVVSCVQSQTDLYVTVTEGTNNHARKWDKGATSAYVTSITPGIPKPAGARSAWIYELETTINTDRANEYVGVCIQRNLRRMYARDIVTTNGSNQITSATAAFTSRDDGAWVLLFGEAIAGAGNNILLAKAVYVNATTIQLKDAAGANVNTQASLTKVYMLVGEYADTVQVTETGDLHLDQFFPLVPDCRSYQIGVGFKTSATDGRISQLSTYGEASFNPVPAR